MTPTLLVPPAHTRRRSRHVAAAQRATAALGALGLLGVAFGWTYEGRART